MLRALPAKSYTLILIGLTIANILVYRAVLAPHMLEVHVFQAGKGTATLVVAPSGKTLLIDTGPDASTLRALGGALPEWQRTIDAVVLTSAAALSVGGVPDVARRYHIGELLRFGAQGSRSAEAAVAAAATAASASYQSPAPYGAHLLFATDISITVISTGIFSVSYGTASLPVSSSTPPGTYTPSGNVFIKK